LDSEFARASRLGWPQTCADLREALGELRELRERVADIVFRWGISSHPHVRKMRDEIEAALADQHAPQEAE
jgi:hypothetical protein